MATSQDLRDALAKGSARFAEQLEAKLKHFELERQRQRESAQRDQAYKVAVAEKLLAERAELDSRQRLDQLLASDGKLTRDAPTLGGVEARDAWHNEQKRRLAEAAQRHERALANV